MNVADVIALAEIQSEEVYDSPVWIKYINAALDDLTPVVKLLKSTSKAVTVTAGSATIAYTSDTDLSKAHEFISAFFSPDGANPRQLRRLPLNDNVSEGWKQTDGDLLFQGLGTAAAGDSVRMDYYRKLQYVSTLSDDLHTVAGLPGQYHNLVVSYCVAKAKQREEELNSKNDSYSEYMMGKSQLAIDRIWQMEPQNRKFIRRARIASLVGQQQ